MLELKISLLDRVRRLEEEQRLMTQAFNDLRKRIDCEKPLFQTASAVAAVDLSPPMSAR